MLTPRRQGRLCRLGAGVVAWSMAVVSVAVLAATPAAGAPAGCDANGDGAANGSLGPVFTSGSDAAAAQLQAETGLTLPRPEPARRWRVTVCVEVVDDGNPTTIDRFVTVVGAPTTELRPEAPQWERNALDKAVSDLTPLLFRPGARTSPNVAAAQIVAVEMWLAVDPAAWVPFTKTATDGEVSVTATATPTKMVWEFTDGVTRICDGPGRQYVPGAVGPPSCGRSFERTTDIRPVTASVSIDYAVTWTSTIANRGSLTKRGEPNRYELAVGEVQTYLSDGTRSAPPPPGPLPTPKSTQPINDDNCGWGTFWDCSPTDIIGAIVDVASDVAWDLIPASVKTVLLELWEFIKGCGAFVGESLGSIKSVFAQFGQVLTDLDGFVREKFDVARALYRAVSTDAAGFGTEVLGQAVEWDLFKAYPAMWAGKIGCSIAIGILTDGALSSQRFKDLFGDFNTLRDKINDWMRRRDDSGDLPGGGCRLSSFPTGTEVALADGTRRPIEAVRPGDIVLAYDAAGDTWAPRPVLRQWSYLDTDEMATVRLTDGSTVTATDHHRFWSATRGRFTAADTLYPGERLQTPGGPVVVGAVREWPSGPTLVWELTVAVDHTFAVYAGDHAIAVHNRTCLDPPDAGTISRRLAGDKALDGITVEDVQGAWARYVERKRAANEPIPSQDAWLDQYMNIRRNAGTGSAFENRTLKDIGLEGQKNRDLFQADGIDPFIPDAVRSTNPPSFVEIKDYKVSVLGRTSNAWRQIEYLMNWRRNNQGAAPPSFELFISNGENLTRDFRDKLTEAQRAGLVIEVNGQRWIP